jgi:tetratricopeptide (TPR) repeat protein
MNQTENAATIALLWERLIIPFKVETAYVKDQIASFQNELRTDKGFTWQTWNQAAQWSLQHDTNLEQALQWADSALGPIFGGNTQFGPKATKAQLLQKMGRGDEATALMKQATPLANMQELHAYGRSLLTQKKAKEALDVFQLNFNKNPKEFTAMMGLARGYSANADYKNALKYAQMAATLAPNAQNKTAAEGMIEKLKKGQDVN